MTDHVEEIFQRFLILDKGYFLNGLESQHLHGLNDILGDLADVDILVAQIEETVDIEGQIEDVLEKLVHQVTWSEQCLEFLHVPYVLMVRIDQDRYLVDLCVEHFEIFFIGLVHLQQGLDHLLLQTEHFVHFGKTHIETFHHVLQNLHLGILKKQSKTLGCTGDILIDVFFENALNDPDHILLINSVFQQLN
jgi:hypothetical protein